MTNNNINNQQKVVILAGPHKTGSSRTQSFILNHYQQGNLNPFVWPINPCGTKKESKQFSLFSWDIFNKVILRQNDNSQHNKNQYPNTTSNENNSNNNKLFQVFYKPCKRSNNDLDRELPIRNCYKKNFQQIWDVGNSIIIAAEILGSFSLHDVSYDFINGLLDLMPMEEHDEGTKRRKISNDKISVVLNYRTNRLEHLTSVWEQSTREQGYSIKARTFLDWIHNMDCTLPEPKLNLNTINTLGQALSYANFQGINVFIVDMQGVEEDGLDITQTIICEIFDSLLYRKNSISCKGETTTLTSSIAQRQSRSNARIDIANIYPKQKIQLSNILHDLDCSYQQSIVMNDNITILHESSSMFRNCSEYDSSRPFLLLHGMKHACGLIKNVMNMEEEQENNMTLDRIHDISTSSSQNDNEQNKKIFIQQNETHDSLSNYNNHMNIDPNYKSISMALHSFKNHLSYIFLIQIMQVFFLVWTILVLFRRRMYRR